MTARPPTASDVIDDLQLTALHEAAHAVVAVNLGVEVTEASIRPEPASSDGPPSLGHVCFWRHPDPQPQDCWEGSHWTKRWVMTMLAGYILEEELMEGQPFQPAVWDNAQVIHLLRRLKPRQPVEGLRVLEKWRSATCDLLLEPDVAKEVLAAADLLLELEVVDGRTFYNRLYGGMCSARNPEESGTRCEKRPHRFGPHLRRSPDNPAAAPMVWAGLSTPNPRERVSAMSTKQRNIRAVNLGQPPDRIPRSWAEALDQIDL